MSSFVRKCSVIGWLALTIVGLDITLADAQGQQSTQDRPASAPAAAPASATRVAPASQPATPARIPISFSNTPLSEIAKFLTERMGKPVIVAKEVQSTQVTLVNPKPIPVEEALDILATALHEAGVAIEERERTIHLIPIAQVSRAQIRTVPADVDLATVKPASQIIRKIFEVKHYDPTKLVDVLKPLTPSYGHITAEPSTGRLIVVAAVEQLKVMAQVIAELDRPDVSGGELRVFPVEHVDVYEIIPLLQKLIAGYLGSEVKTITSGGTEGSPSPGGPPSGSPSDGRRPGGGPSDQSSAAPASAGAILVKGEKKPVLIIPEPRRKSIVVAAPSNVLAQVEVWMKSLDQEKPPSAQEEIVEVRYGNAQDLATQLTAMLSNIPDETLRSALRIFPFAGSGRLMIVGSEKNRRMVKEWLKEIDVPPGERVTRTFNLKNADAQQITDNIKELFQDSTGSRGYSIFSDYYDDYYSSRRRSTTDRTKVTVTANTRNNSVTVASSPEMMERIAKQIEEWDRPLAGDEAAPRIFHLKCADPDKTKTLLESLFTKKDRPILDWFGRMTSSDAQATPVGRLFGQFRFEAYPETGKLLVVSKNPENYTVIEKMIEEIDRPQTVGLPRIIQLKFADAETLAEQLNALLNAPGTPTSILRRGHLGTFMESTDKQSPFNSNTDQARNPADQQNKQSTPTQMQFWWQNPPADIKVKQPSNLVGKLRIVPNVEQNSLLVVAPEEYAEAIDKFVRDLDKPGYQVLVRAVVAEITLNDSMSLGFRFSTDTSAFTTGDSLITENALRGLLTYDYKDQFGTHQTLTLNVPVNNLLSLLGKVTNLKIKSEPKILTADNVEAQFFDGQDVPFIKNTLTSDVGSQTQAFDYRAVGMRLRVRPHITKEKNVDLTVNLEVSNIVPGQTLFGGAIIDRRETTTRIVLEDGHTFLISGIIREQDGTIVRRFPGLGDIPGLGELFKHRETTKVNTELLVFLTPYVIGPQDPRGPIESVPQDRLERQFPSGGGVEDVQKPEVVPATPVGALIR
ncbi:MAG TPA: secretin N-terminal domain-containing protein [Phycisphaerae bacterium]|nr:secretin N-terminal domain-containing protein [Phycisphaerae bacterium]HRY69680.1 secretin N-terminal domain-containing protein [Phycisphaerae bacterium]HSA25123.1 secretin N-terminal domain-containing protein [Phycisphaerae bacterium]